MTFWQRWKQTALHNKALVWATFLMAIGTIFYAGAACWQIHIMDKAAKDSTAESERTNRVITDRLNQLIGNSNWLAREMNYARDSASNTARQEQQSAKDALDASIAASRNDQRAWLSILWEYPQGPIPNGLLKTPVRITNTGRSPALNVVGDITQTIMNSGTRPDFDDRCKLAQHFERGTIFPDSPQPINVLVRVNFENGSPCPVPVGGNREHPFTENAFLVVFGKISYTDVFDGAHWMKFCRSENGQPVGVGDIPGCAEYNAVDKDEPPHRHK